MIAGPHRSWLLVLLLLGGCAIPDPSGDGAPGKELRHQVTLFDARAAIQDAWFHMPLREATDYRLAVFDGTVAIRARGRHSASGLIRRIALNPHLCPEIEWTWAVTRLQATANLHEKSGDDVAASILLLFGDPGLLSSPNRVPTLRYVWTTDHAEPGAVIDNPYLSGMVRSIVVETRAVPVTSWVTARRHVANDFTLAFGEEPSEDIRAIALLTDNDQTGEPVEAYYGWARAYCTEEAAPEAPDLWQGLQTTP